MSSTSRGSVERTDEVTEKVHMKGATTTPTDQSARRVLGRRHLLTGTAIGSSAVRAVLWSVRLMLVGFTAAALLFRRRTRR